MAEKDIMQCDSLIIGAGPAGLAAAIRLAQLTQDKDHNIIVLEKGSQVGAHLISGAVIETGVLDELLPHWRDDKAFPVTSVSSERFAYLTSKKSYSLPLPKHLTQHGCSIISIGQLCQYLASQAEALGVQIFPGFAATDLHWNEDHTRIAGVQTGDMGDQPGIIIEAKHTFFAEGCRGFLSEQVIEAFNLRESCGIQHYGLGIKEKWRVDTTHHTPGHVEHTIGWPLKDAPYGGGFLYHAEAPYIVVGFISALDYSDPQFSPFEQLQRYKTHPSHAHLFESGECVGYGARAINEGGWQSIPQCDFPGGYLIGCTAGFVDIARIKGIHHAMRTGMLCADHALHDSTSDVTATIKSSPTGKALYRSRNVRSYFKYGNTLGLVLTAIDQWVFRGRTPWTLSLPKADHDTLTHPTQTKSPWQPDRRVTFDRLTQLQHSNTHHQENAQSHLLIQDRETNIAVNLNTYGGPEAHYCPAHVYEYLEKDGKPFLQINAQNCIHCKTCTIKDPAQNIRWTPPQGGDGPNYVGM